MTETYQEYPMTLAHPAFKPSIATPIPGSQVYDGKGEIVRQDFQGSPLVLPPITVRNEGEEEYYRAQGYERAGKMDPSAWVRAHADAPPVDYKPAMYPKWGKNAEGNPTLYQSAADDPNATEGDLYPAPEPKVEAAPPAIVPTEASNLRAQMEDMNRQMAAMMEQMQAAQAESARLTAEAAQRASESAAPAKRRGGRPRKLADA